MMHWDKKAGGHDFEYTNTGNMLGTKPAVATSYYKCSNCNAIVEHSHGREGLYEEQYHCRLDSKLLTEAPIDSLPSCDDIRMNEALGEDS